MVRLKIGLDWDDVVAPFNSLAIRMANEKYDPVPPLKFSEIDSWANTGRAGVIKEFYHDDRLYELQAQSIPQKNIDAVRRLEAIADVYFITAVFPEYMTQRAAVIQNIFPELGADRMIFGSAKNLVHFDITLDDNISNVLGSKAEFPVLMRKPWNRNMTGLLSVNDLDEFVTLVGHITRKTPYDPTLPAVHVIVGPSGSKKREIAGFLDERPDFSLVKSYSTKRCPEYRYMSSEDFKEELEHNSFVEHTFYGGYEYGTLWDDVIDILNKGINPVMILDICGAIGMKRQFDNTRMIYIKRGKEDIIRSIVSDDSMTAEEKTLRLLSIDVEKKNEKICDKVYTADEKYFAEEIASWIASDKEE